MQCRWKLLPYCPQAHCTVPCSTCKIIQLIVNSRVALLRKVPQAGLVDKLPMHDTSPIWRQARDVNVCMICSPMARRALSLHKPNSPGDSQSPSPTPPYPLQQASAQQPSPHVKSQAPRMQSLAAASSFAASAAASAAVATEAAALTKIQASLQSDMQQQQQQWRPQQGTEHQQVSVHAMMLKFCWRQQQHQLLSPQKQHT